MLNNKMQSVMMTIEYYIEQNFSLNYLHSVFNDKITLRDLTIQIMIECCKFAFDNVLEKKSLRSHLINAGKTEDHQRMMIQRTLKRINKFRQEEYYFRKIQSGIEIPNLLPPEMNDMESKLMGYQYNDFQFWEINNVHDMQLVNVIINDRINKKNFTNESFREYAKEYDNIIKSFVETINECNMDSIFSFFKIFVLEWKYSFDYYYEIAVEMEKNEKTYISDLGKKCCLFCGTPQIMTEIDNIVLPVCVDSRMFHLRRRFIDEFISISDEEEFERETFQYREALVILAIILTNMKFERKKIRDWFVTNSTIQDWYSVLSEYNIEDCFIPQKEWTNKRIRYVKSIYSATHIDLKKFKNPNFRS